jgi:hypothetical protein
MKTILTLFFGACFLLMVVFMKIHLRRKRDKIRPANLDAHMQILNEGIERVAQENPALVGDSGALPPMHAMRDQWGFPPPQYEVIEEIAVADDGHSNWDYIVHIHEGAEPYLGTKHFLTLEERFSKIRYVDACQHEDREIFLIRSRNVSIGELREAIWQAFLAAAETSYDKKDER